MQGVVQCKLILATRERRLLLNLRSRLHRLCLTLYDSSVCPFVPRVLLDFDTPCFVWKQEILLNDSDERCCCFQSP